MSYRKELPVEEKLAEWIDTIVIAEEILFHLRATGLPPTYENATRVWLNFLEAEIHEGLRNSCQGLLDNLEVLNHARS